MNVEKFNKMFEKRIIEARKTLASKNKEYASDTDKLSNFKRAGDMLQCSPEYALVGMWTKHIISILDIVDKIDKEDKAMNNMFVCKPDSITIKLINEKIGDAVNYLILLEALLKERYEA